MTDISKIQNLLDWKLLTGSHEWPGPDGGTCINEAAIVVAGFHYSPVGGPEDFPPCFSTELGMLLLSLNDALSDERRQKLMRFVLRLPGSKDVAKVERRRCRFLHDGIQALLVRYQPSARFDLGPLALARRSAGLRRPGRRGHRQRRRAPPELRARRRLPRRGARHPRAGLRHRLPGQAGGYGAHRGACRQGARPAAGIGAVSRARRPPAAAAPWARCRARAGRSGGRRRGPR